MRRLVSTLSPELATMLEEDLLKRADLHLIAARSIEELVAYTQEGAEVCLVEPLLPDGDAVDALEAVRATTEGSRVPVVLVHTADALIDDASGFSARLQLPAAPGAVEDLLARLLGEPRRRGDRRPVSGLVRDEEGQPLGRLVDLSRGGLALRTRRSLAAGSTLALSMELPLAAERLAARARVLRTAGEHVALALEQPGPELVEALEVLLVRPPVAGMGFRPVPRLGERAAAIGGSLLEGPARVALRALLAGGSSAPARLIVNDLSPFDEAALDRWIELVAEHGPLELLGCPIWLRALLGRIPASQGRGPARARIASMQVPLHCRTCDDANEAEARLSSNDRAAVVAAVEGLVALPCFVCGGEVEATEGIDAIVFGLAG